MGLDRRRATEAGHRRADASLLVLPASCGHARVRLARLYAHSRGRGLEWDADTVRECDWTGVAQRAVWGLRMWRYQEQLEVVNRRIDVYVACNGICWLCGGRCSPGPRWSVDHIRPVALGGTDALYNLRLAHSRCHKERHGAKKHPHPRDFRYGG